jgi:aminoacrylate hydrolase
MMRTVGDIDVHYESVGEGPALILVSGLGGTANFWKPNVEAFAGRNTVISYDQRGVGATSRPEQDYSVEILADDLLALMDSLGIARASIVGHSTGGAIGQVVAARYPDRVENLVLYGSWLSDCVQLQLSIEARRELLASGGTAAYYRYSPLFLYPPNFISQNKANMERTLAARIGASSPASILDARMRAVLAFDGNKYAERIAAPTIVAVAEDDVLTPVYASHEVAGKVRNSTMHVFPYGGHCASFCDPQPFNHVVSDFLARNA